MKKNTYKNKHVSQDQVSEFPDLPMEVRHKNRPLSRKERFVCFMSLFCLFIKVAKTDI